ncbi:unnamed protein product [Albugo candida]|uniref:Uncharacterized protein n=1 Tax=Albugo candida TaxID=65357 RepID=A0A024FT17_9STRA|nr:unnamed protein product [Albugo candida]|eukprot:CCI10218.1 unnamed protein product [Albugo candida]
MVASHCKPAYCAAGSASSGIEGRQNRVKKRGEKRGNYASEQFRDASKFFFQAFDWLWIKGWPKDNVLSSKQLTLNGRNTSSERKKLYDVACWYLEMNSITFLIGSSATGYLRSALNCYLHP